MASNKKMDDQAKEERPEEARARKIRGEDVSKSMVAGKIQTTTKAAKGKKEGAARTSPLLLEDASVVDTTDDHEVRNDAGTTTVPTTNINSSSNTTSTATNTQGIVTPGGSRSSDLDGAINGGIDGTAESDSNNEEERLAVAEIVNDMPIDDEDGLGDDDSDIENRVKARIRERILENATEAQVIKIENHDDDKKNDTGSRNSPKNNKTNAIVSVVFLAVVITFAVVIGNIILPKKRSSKDSNDNGNDNDGIGSTAVTRREKLLNILSPLYYSVHGDGIDNTFQLLTDETYSSSPQYRAFQWIVDVDEYYKDDGIDIDYGDDDDDDAVELLIERYALTVLYYSTDGANSWENQMNFLDKTTSVCEWFVGSLLADELTSNETTKLILSGNNDEVDEGLVDPNDNLKLQSAYGVSCDQGTGRVSIIQITSNNMNGTLPMEIAWLHSLERLHLYSNSLSGTIPTEYNGTNLPWLDSIQLSRNRLTGTLPESLSTLSNLHTLILFQNSLRGTIPPSLFTHLVDLEIFNVWENQLTGTIPESGDDVTAFAEIYFGDNQFTGTIPTSLHRMTSLEVISFEQNMLTGSIPSEFGFLQDVRTFSFYENMIGGTIPTELGLATRMVNFWLGVNELKGTIPSELGAIDRMEYFSVPYNMLTGEVPPDLFLGRWSSTLSKLELHFNQLSGTIPYAISFAKELFKVNLHNNSFVGDLDPLICNEATGVLVSLATADCGVYSEGYPPFNNVTNDADTEINCSCCYHCCNDDSGCDPDFDVENTPCEIRRDLISNAFISCECIDDTELILVDNYANGTTMVCDYSPIYQSCNADRTVCAFYKYAVEYDSQGSSIGEYRRYEYNRGPYTGEIVTSANHYADASCDVDVNGVYCDSCSILNCPDLFDSRDVRCDNIENGSQYLGCDASVTDTSSLKVIQVLHPEFGLTIYNAGFCPLLAQYLGAEIDELSCSCSEDGLLLSCDLTCEYCFGLDINTNNTAELNDNDGEGEGEGDVVLCYKYNELFLHSYGEAEAHGIIYNYNVTVSSSSTSESKNITNDDDGNFADASMTTTATTTTNLVTVTQNYPRDQWCMAHIDGRECNDCAMNLCDDGTTQYKIDCTNIDENSSIDNGCNQTSWTFDDVGILQVFQPTKPECVPINGATTTE